MQSEQWAAVSDALLPYEVTRGGLVREGQSGKLVDTYTVKDQAFVRLRTTGGRTLVTSVRSLQRQAFGDE